MDVRLLTYNDSVSHLLDYVGGATDEVNLRRARRAVTIAYSEVTGVRQWSYYHRLGKIDTVASYSTGTITYTHSTLTVTLASGTWPSWAALGTILIDGLTYDVASRTSASVIVLSVNNNPGANVAALTAYTLFQDTYQLPADFVSLQDMVNTSNASRIHFVPAKDWGNIHRQVRNPGQPTRYTIMPSPKYHGVLVARFHQPPSAVLRLDFSYRRTPRPLIWENYHTGTVTLTSASTTVTGTGTSWTSAMIGAVIRFSTDATNLPTAPVGGPGGEPAILERLVTDVASTTSLTIDAVPGQNLTGVLYTISDPCDLEQGAMLNYFLRECERQMRIQCRLATGPEEAQALQTSAMSAFERDARSTEATWQGSGPGYGIDVRDMAPLTPTEET